MAVSVPGWLRPALQYSRKTGGGRMRALGLCIKRVTDLCAVSLLLVLLSPLLLLIALIIKLDSAGPVLFRQDRLGFGGNVFTMLKFRSMHVHKTSSGAPAAVHKDDPRITRVGRILREFRLDELPQFFNIFAGHMSLVGPRPLLPETLADYTPWEKRRMLMPPGMSGWQQINGGANLSWDERVALDVWYVDQWNLWLDVRILFISIPTLLIRREGVYASDGWQRGGAPPSRHRIGKDKEA